jgi:hypothetical protein
MKAAALRPESRWPRWLRRGRMETVSTVVIAAGVALYTCSFVTTLVGTALFTVVSKFPE